MPHRFGTKAAFLIGLAAAASLVATVVAAPSAGSARAAGGVFIYWTNPQLSTIGRANLDGTGANEHFIRGANDPGFVAVNGKYLYWANEGATLGITIGRANIDGTAANENFITVASGPNGVAVNSKYIYWANDGGTTIGRANLDGTHANQHFIADADAPCLGAVG